MCICRKLNKVALLLHLLIFNYSLELGMKRILFFILLITSNVWAYISIDAGLYNEDIKQFFISDLDLTQKGTSPLIFWVRFQNSQQTASSVYLRLTFIFEDRFTGKVSEILQGQSKPFNIPATGLSLTNQDFFSGAGEYGLDHYNLDEKTAGDILDYVLSSGKIPAGRYEFIFRVFESQNNSQLDETAISFTITDQISIDLISPGEKAHISDVVHIYTKLPHFRWESNATEFRLRVCEKMPGNNSPDEVMNNTPRFESIIENQKFVQYPVAGAFPLEVGQTYFWQVIALVATSNTTIEYPSEIWGFRIADAEEGANSGKHIQILNYLKLLLGDENYEQIFGENGALSNYQSTGVVRKNGVHINMQELNQLLIALSNNEIQVGNFSIE